MLVSLDFTCTIFSGRMLPKDAMLEAGKFFGVDKCMDTFVGRKKKE